MEVVGVKAEGGSLPSLRGGGAEEDEPEAAFLKSDAFRCRVRPTRGTASAAVVKASCLVRQSGQTETWQRRTACSRALPASKVKEAFYPLPAHLPECLT
jgi:hypothetical protein